MEEPTPILKLPLPVLPVCQEKYCDQAKTDQIIHFIHQKRPDLLQKLREAWHQSIVEYWMVIPDIVDYLRNDASQETDIPEPRLAMLDIIFELHRRFMSAIEEGVPQILGHSILLADGKQLVPLAMLPVKRKEITQQLADKTSKLLYVKKPDIFNELAECVRRDFPPLETNSQFLQFLKEFANELDYKGEYTPALLSEIGRRAKAMCEIKDR